jgi:hypothetical protein
MPRQIIDTESSRPAYQRRVLLRWLLVLLIFITVVLVATQVWKAHRPSLLNLAPVPINRSIYAA